jgi:predicted Zn-dependent protease
MNDSSVMGIRWASVRRIPWAATIVMAVWCGAAGAASIDLGRLFGAGKDLATAASGMDEKEEIAVGREVAGRTLGAAPLVADPALQAYVNSVGRWVASQTERPDLPWHFGVIDSPAINAFAAPGGYVLITRGLYEILDSEAQLAGVLGHEIGHIVKRHHITVMQKSALISAGSQLATARTDRAAVVNNLIGTGAEVFARGLDKSAEFEADQIGIVLAARAGYSPYGLVGSCTSFRRAGRRTDRSRCSSRPIPIPTSGCSSSETRSRRGWPNCRRESNPRSSR